MAFTLTVPTYMLDKPILTALDSTGDAAPVHEPGYTVTATDGREFKYVRFSSSEVAAIAGAPCAFAQSSDDNEFIVTADVSDGGEVGIGCFLSVLTDTYYGWIQTAGFVKDVPCSGSQAETTAGDELYATDGVWKIGVVGDNHIAAVAIEASSSAIGNIMLLKQ